jgi:hypothetical protein
MPPGIVSPFLFLVARIQKNKEISKVQKYNPATVNALRSTTGA